MGILERMRSGSDSTFMQVVLALIIVAFIGLNGQMFGDRSATVATVNGTKILDTEFQRMYRARLRDAEARAQRTLSDAEQKDLSERVLQSMIDREVMLQEARRLGLEVSDSEVARSVLELPFLRDSKNLTEDYNSFLKRQQLTRDEFEARQRDDLLFLKLQTLMATAASLSDPAVRDMYVEAATQVDLQLVRVRPSAFESSVTITDEERTKWLAENDALVQETYDRDFDRMYNHPEQVRLRMIRLAVLPEGPPLGDLVPRLNTLREQIEGGADMGELAKRWSEDPTAKEGGDLGLRPVAQLTTEVARGVEGLQPGQLSRVITTDSDARLVRLEERVAPKVDTIEEVRNTIADRLIKAERVPTMAAEFAENELLPKWKEAGAPPEELLAAKGLSARPTGPIPTYAQSGSPLSPPQDLLDAARRAEVGSVLPEVFEAGGVYYVAQLTNRIDPDMALFEAEKDKFREQALSARRAGFYEAWVADLKSRAKIQ